ncbi:MAG: nucleoside monophosphate kinase [Patescibacteria group bacterium]
MAKTSLKKIILLGPQGSGKSTQDKVIADFLHVPILASGDLLRKAISQKTDLGNRLANFVNKGELIPDALMIDLFLTQLQQDQYGGGFILDGFPRNLNQAANLDRHYLIDKVFNIEIPDETAIERISGRRICPNGHVWHIEHKKSLKEELCDICHQALFYREDDKPELVKKRLAIYRQETSKLLSYYDQQHKLVVFDGTGSIPQVSERILAYLKENVG